MTEKAKKTRVADVLPDDEALGRRNYCWRNLVKKFEGTDPDQEEQDAMEVDQAMILLNQEPSNESSVSDVEEAKSDVESEEEPPEDIQRQLRRAIPSRKRTWQKNGLLEIMQDQDFSMLSHEKVENWLQSRLHGINRCIDLQYESKVTTITETCVDADADSQYSVDTAQYILSNKKISNKIKVTTMIKQYAVTNTIRSRRIQSIGDLPPTVDEVSRKQLPSLREKSKSDSCFEGSNQSVVSEPKVPDASPAPRAKGNRRKVFKKTVPKKRSTHSSPIARLCPAEIYEKALINPFGVKKLAKPSTKRLSRRNIRALPSGSNSSSSDDDDKDDVFGRSTRPKLPPNRKKKTPTNDDGVMISPPKRFSADREIVAPFEAISLGIAWEKRRRLKTHQEREEDCVSNGSNSTTRSQATVKRSSDQLDGTSESGLVIYRPKSIRPELDEDERIHLRMQDLTLDGITKERHLSKFREFAYHIHPNSTVRFYPSDSDDKATNESSSSSECQGLDTSYDDDDPLLSLRPGNLLNVVEIPYRKEVDDTSGQDHF